MPYMDAMGFVSDTLPEADIISPKKGNFESMISLF